LRHSQNIIKKFATVKTLSTIRNDTKTSHTHVLRKRRTIIYKKLKYYQQIAPS